MNLATLHSSWRGVPFAALNLGELFFHDGQFYVKVSHSIGRRLDPAPLLLLGSGIPVDPREKFFMGVMVRAVHFIPVRDMYVVEFLTLTEAGPVLERKSGDDWPEWAAPCRRAQPEPTPSAWASFRKGWREGWAEVRGLFNSALTWLSSRSGTDAPDDMNEMWTPHEWHCPSCGKWNPDYRDERPCGHCQGEQPSINEYRKRS